MTNHFDLIRTLRRSALFTHLPLPFVKFNFEQLSSPLNSELRRRIYIFPDTCCRNLGSIDRTLPREWMFPRPRRSVGCAQIVRWRFSPGAKERDCAECGANRGSWRDFDRMNCSPLANVGSLNSRDPRRVWAIIRSRDAPLADACKIIRVCVQGIRRRHRGALWNDERGLNCVSWKRQGKGWRRMGNQYMAGLTGWLTPCVCRLPKRFLFFYHIKAQLEIVGRIWNR